MSPSDNVTVGRSPLLTYVLGFGSEMVGISFRRVELELNVNVRNPNSIYPAF